MQKRRDGEPLVSAPRFGIEFRHGRRSQRRNYLTRRAAKGWPLFQRWLGTPVGRGELLRPLSDTIPPFVDLHNHHGFPCRPRPFSTAANHSIEARPSANHESDYKLTCRFFEFITNVRHPPLAALLLPSAASRGADYNYRAFCFAIAALLLAFSPSRGRVKFRLFFNLLPCVEFARIGQGDRLISPPRP